MQKFNKNLIEFIKSGTCTFTTTLKTIEILEENGYQALKESEIWKLENNKYYVIRNDASIIAFNINKNIKNQFNIVATHNDTPAFSIKPNAEFYENDYLKLNISPYGGILNYGFMDRPLSLAGRIIIKENDNLIKEIIDIKKDIAIIPSIAIHQNDKANTNLNLNAQNDLVPIISLNKNYSLKEIIKIHTTEKKDLFDYDLFLYNTEEPKIINNEFLASPRIDNLTCTYAALEAFLNNFNDAINVLAVFNSEEIGSNTLDGADSNFLIDTLKKICSALNLDLYTTLSNSLVISADNTHAKHPNGNDLSDHCNNPILNSGILIMKETNGTTNSISASIFRKICEDNKIPYSYYTSRNDLTTGSTQAGVSLKHVSINSLDIGLPMLAMHSSLELIGIKDTYTLFKALNIFYKTNYKFENNKIIFD